MLEVWESMLSMVQTQLEQVAKSQRELLDEMNNNMHDFAVRVATRGGKMTQEPLYPEGHPKRIEQVSQRVNTDAPSPSRKKKKKKNDRTLHASSELEIEKPPDNLSLIIKHGLTPWVHCHNTLSSHVIIGFYDLYRQNRNLNEVVLIWGPHVLVEVHL